MLSSQLTQLINSDFDLDFYRLDYERARTNYIKVFNINLTSQSLGGVTLLLLLFQAAEAFKLAEGPYEASRDAYVAAVR